MSDAHESNGIDFARDRRDRARETGRARLDERVDVRRYCRLRKSIKQKSFSSGSNSGFLDFVKKNETNAITSSDSL
jgi:hypothetical protein